MFPVAFDAFASSCMRLHLRARVCVRTSAFGCVQLIERLHEFRRGWISASGCVFCSRTFGMHYKQNFRVSSRRFLPITTCKSVWVLFGLLLTMLGQCYNCWVGYTPPTSCVVSVCCMYHCVHHISSFGYIQDGGQ